MNLWSGRFGKALDAGTNDFNSSISFDSAMYREDIAGSIAHAKMLAAQGIITAEDAAAITAGLQGIQSDIENGARAQPSAAREG